MDDAAVELVMRGIWWRQWVELENEGDQSVVRGAGRRQDGGLFLDVDNGDKEDEESIEGSEVDSWVSRSGGDLGGVQEGDLDDEAHTTSPSTDLRSRVGY
ncbi:uncharacterized protein A4U43_C09F4290 [Asparagus officinalis]|uniref:Uncharacterized protein n=1 Tax=Asparagus officinalis TaxID=4686 RepID=A0A5P1E8L0_ASPOF|nr:uncharacterized protein A4U43_C09F4290 [Asparagus officinalis]